jgi:hypothetical protein
MIKLTQILLEQSDLYKYIYPKDTLYKYAVKNNTWWAKNIETGKEFDLSTNSNWQSSIDKLDKQFPKARKNKKKLPELPDDDLISTKIQRNKFGWIIPSIETDITIADQTKTPNWQPEFTKLQNKVNQDLKRILVGSKVKARNKNKYVYAFSGDDTNWRQYDLTEFSNSGWPLDASGTANIKPNTIQGQIIGDVYVLISWSQTKNVIKSKFECSVVWIGGKINSWIPTSYIDIIV